jgi:hypothetical protein
MARYLTASEAIEMLNIPASTFYRLVKEGKITKYYPTAVSKHGMYRPGEIMQLRSQFGQASEIGEVGETGWVESTDIGNIYDLEYPIFGDETINPTIVRKWYERNPRIYHLLFKKGERRDLWGVMNMLPLEEETIFKLLRGEIREADLDPLQDILTFDRPGVYNLYVPSVVLRAQKWQHFVVLISSVFDYWCAQAPERVVGKIYARVASKQGEMLAKKLFFSPLWHISDSAYMLDLRRPNPSRLIQNFQQCVESKREEGR